MQNQKASVLLRDLDGLELVEEDLKTTWGQFFPGVEAWEKESFPYPLPYTGKFSRVYAEPVAHFCLAAEPLVRAMSHLGATPPKIEGDPQLARGQALNAINIVRRSVTSVVEIDSAGKPKIRWVAPSLLASFAEMFVQDLTFGRPTQHCEACGVGFVSGAYQARYCSQTCRYREQKRRLREQIKQAKKLRKQGETIRQIASALGQEDRQWLACEVEG